MTPSRTASFRADLSARVKARGPEIEQSILARVNSVSDPGEIADPEYAQGLRVAVAAALNFGLAGIEGGEDNTDSIPEVLLGQARLAARSGVGLDTVLRRYFAGFTLLGDVLIQEAKAGSAHGPTLQQVSREQATLFDRLVTAITEEFTREEEKRARTVEQRRAERVEQLLAGELLDTSDLEYDFDAWHLGAVAAGSRGEKAMRDLLHGLDCGSLLVPRGEDTVWAWFSARRPLDPAELLKRVRRLRRVDLHIAFGEPCQRLSGWRLTHRQASSALLIALRGTTSAVRYADVALLASILRDDVLATSLRKMYLAPLTAGRDGGETLRETLRAYFSAGRNVSSTAAHLGVKRHTVTKRLRVVEERIGRPIDSCSAELEAVIRLSALRNLNPAAAT